MSFESSTPAVVTNQPAPVQKPGNGFGITALVLGIVAIVASFIPVLGTVAFILGPLAIIFGILGIVLRKHAKRGTSITGIILGAVAVVIAIIVTAVTALFVTSVGNSISSASAAANAEISVQYIATSSTGAAKVMYGSTSGTSTKSFTGNWKADSKLKGFDVSTLVVTGDFSTPGQALSCEIKIDGKSVVKNSGDSSVTCTAPSK